MSDRQERIWRCDCGAGHFLSIEQYSDKVAVGGYLQVDDHCIKMLRARLRWAWNILRNGHAETSAGVLLDAATARQIAGVLDVIAIDAEAAQNKPPPVPEDDGEL